MAFGALGSFTIVALIGVAFWGLARDIPLLRMRKRHAPVVRVQSE